MDILMAEDATIKNVMFDVIVLVVAAFKMKNGTKGVVADFAGIPFVLTHQCYSCLT